MQTVTTVLDPPPQEKMFWGKEQRYDWALIRKEYVEGVVEQGYKFYPSFRELEKRHKVAAEVTWRRATREGWKKDRNKHQFNVNMARLEVKPKDTAARGQEADAICIENARKGLAFVNNGMVKLAQEYRREELKEAGGEKFKYSPLWRTLNMLADAQVKWQRTLKLAIGEPTDIDDHRVSFSQLSDNDKEIMDHMVRRRAEALKKEEEKAKEQPELVPKALNETNLPG